MSSNQDYLPFQPGRSFSVRENGLGEHVRTKLRTMKLIGIGVQFNAHITFFDAKGISLRIGRYGTFGGVVEGFVPAGTINFGSWFDLHDAIHPSEAEASHFSRVFPRDFLP